MTKKVTCLNCYHLKTIPCTGQRDYLWQNALATCKKDKFFDSEGDIRKYKVEYVILETSRHSARWPLLAFNCDDFQSMID